MKPDKKFITINNNENLISRLLMELVLTPRLKALEWSRITDQTPNLKIGYPGQHLASLILGMKGTKTGARGNDIIDGTEVKSCSRVDALDKCNECKAKVLRSEAICPNCKSSNISRDNTSKWLFTIRSDNDLLVLTKEVKRVVLILADYPEFDNNNFDKIQIQAFEIWTNSERCSAFKTLMTNYYNNIYLEHKKKDNTKTPAPKNFWPYSYQFYLCNPIKIFSCVIENANTDPSIKIEHYTMPNEDRTKLESEKMPIKLLKYNELQILTKVETKDLVRKCFASDGDYQSFCNAVNKNDSNLIVKLLPYVREDLRKLLPLRDDSICEMKGEYIRQ